MIKIEYFLKNRISNSSKAIRLFMETGLKAKPQIPKKGIRKALMKILTLLLISFFLIFSSNCFAEISADLKLLISDSSTMLDWGLLNLERDFERLDDQEGFEGFQLTTSYDFEKNKIEMNVLPHSDRALKNRKEDEAKSLCFEMFKYIREKLWVNSETGEGRGVKENVNYKFSKLWLHFSLEGDLSWSNEPFELYKEIENITRIHITMPISDNFKYISCKAPLMYNEVLFSFPRK